MRRILLATLALVLMAAPSTAQVVGRAAALGSDTLMLNEQVYQLYGIDGVEFHQFCFVDGEPWACGASATRALQTLVDPVVVSCTPTDETNGEAIYAVCTTDDGDIAETMVAQGWALANRAQSDDYVAAEEEARAAGAGVWRGMSIEPWTYRDDIAAIERRYAELIAEPLRTEAEQALTAEGNAIGAFADVTIRTIELTDTTATADYELRIDGVEGNFFYDAIPSRDVFTWAAVVDALDNWRNATVASVRQSAVTAVRQSLIDHANQVVETTDADGYYAAMTENAAGWIEQGRQPVLILRSPSAPRWMGDWLAGNLPVGAALTHRDDITSANYLGTINGIDVYVGVTPAATSLLLPGDLLNSLSYRIDGDGTVLQLTTDDDTNTVTFRYALGIDWKDDPVIWLAYPPTEGDNPYGG